MVLLLIVVATLPGISFSLSSSVTSYNNQITIIEDSSIGFYKESTCNNRWGPGVFSSGAIGLNSSTVGGTTTYSTDTAWKNLSGVDTVYFRSGGSFTTLTITGSYSSDNESRSVVNEVRITFDTIDRFSSSTGTVISWTDAGNEGFAHSLQIEVGVVYQMMIEVRSTSAHVLTDLSDIGIDLSFIAAGPSVSSEILDFSGEKLRLAIKENTYNGVSLGEGNHQMEEYTGSEFNNAAIITTGNGDDSFVGTSKGSASATLTSDGKNPFKLYLYVGTQSKSGFQVKVTIGNGNPITYPSNQNQYIKENCYLGSDGYNSDPSKVTSFNSTVKIEITANQHSGSDNHEVRLYIVFDSVTSAVAEDDPSDSPDDFEIIANREE